MMTVQILIGNDEKFIRQTIESVRQHFVEIPYEIVVGDTGCTDKTANICRKSGCVVIESRGRRDFARNLIIDQRKNDWHFYLEPGEVVADLGDVFAKLQEEQPATYTILQGGIASKQVRLHRKTCRFINPIFERWNSEPTLPIGTIFSPIRDTYSRDLGDATRWVEKSPQDPSARYYLACVRLGMKDFPSFLQDAENYLFAERNPAAYMPVTMIRFYCATIQCYVKKDATKATQNIVACIAANPLMAEFWCLAGDIKYYLTNEYQAASLLYENAIELGCRRMNSDNFPMEIAKYHEYPSKMIESCKKILSLRTTVKANI